MLPLGRINQLYILATRSRYAGPSSHTTRDELSPDRTDRGAMGHEQSNEPEFPIALFFGGLVGRFPVLGAVAFFFRPGISTSERCDEGTPFRALSVGRLQDRGWAEGKMAQSIINRALPAPRFSSKFECWRRLPERHSVLARTVRFRPCVGGLDPYQIRKFTNNTKECGI
jgi:hypothetical protein